MTKMKRLLRPIYLWLTDALLLGLGLFLALAMRLDLGSAEPVRAFLGPLAMAALIIFVLYGILYFAFGLHRVIWQYANLRDVLRVCLAVCVCVGMTMGVQVLADQVPSFLDAPGLPSGQYRLPWGVYPIWACVGASLLVMRYMVQREIAKRMHKRKSAGATITTTTSPLSRCGWRRTDESEELGVRSQELRFLPSVDQVLYSSLRIARMTVSHTP